MRVLPLKQALMSPGIDAYKGFNASRSFESGFSLLMPMLLYMNLIDSFLFIEDIEFLKFDNVFEQVRANSTTSNPSRLRTQLLLVKPSLLAKIKLTLNSSF